jgi:zeaxanthin epoxidase
VSYQILLGKDKYFVSTDAGGERQQWFALVRTPPGGQDADPTAAAPTPKRDRLLAEFSDASPGDGNGDVWDGFARELVEATREAEIKRRDLYDGAPLLREPARWLAPWADGCVAIAGDAAHPMMPNLGQGGCQSCEDGFRLVEELAAVRQTGEVAGALARYSRVRVLRTAAIQGLAQLGSDLLIDFDKMMSIPIVGPFFLKLTQVSMPWVLRFLYTANF